MTTPHDQFERASEPKRPEIIVVDETHEEARGNQQEQFESFDFLKNQKVKYPMTMRVIAVLATMCALGWVIGCIVSGIIFFALALVTFFQVEQLNTYALRTWSFFKTAVVGLLL